MKAPCEFEIYGDIEKQDSLNININTNYMLVILSLT